jgi:hypothetical protein
LFERYNVLCRSWRERTWFPEPLVFEPTLDINGNLFDDFHFVYADGMVHVCNVASPAATASLAIGKYIVDTIFRHYGVNPGALN